MFPNLLRKLIVRVTASFRTKSQQRIDVTGTIEFIWSKCKELTFFKIIWEKDF